MKWPAHKIFIMRLVIKPYSTPALATITSWSSYRYTSISHSSLPHSTTSVFLYIVKTNFSDCTASMAKNKCKCLNMEGTVKEYSWSVKHKLSSNHETFDASHKKNTTSQLRHKNSWLSAVQILKKTTPPNLININHFKFENLMSAELD